MRAYWELLCQYERIKNLTGERNNVCICQYVRKYTYNKYVHMQTIVQHQNTSPGTFVYKTCMYAYVCMHMYDHLVAQTFP